MSYQLADGWSSVNFVRPAHGLVALHGDTVIDVQALGLRATRITQGHRFEAASPSIELRHADSYAEQLLSQGGVIASYEQRAREMIRQLRAAANRFDARLECEPAVPLLDAQAEEGLLEDPLVNEVASLVERPNVLVCEFESAFLTVPQECLILTMKTNQKYFPLVDAQGRLMQRFLVVSNIRPADASRVIEGNQRVVRPRLADAKFFFDQDRKQRLDSRVPALAKVVYHARLGSMGERVERVRTLARTIGDALGGTELAQAAERAALLAKADLLTDMVGEFPELQGVMGGYYALNDGEPVEVARAIEDHYKPRFAGDELPRDRVGVALALADKLETLAGLFGIGQLPTGDKDPFALRRHALGVIRMLNEGELRLPLDWLVSEAYAAFPPGLITDNQAELRAFMLERLAGALREQGYSVNEVDAVMATNPQSIQLVRRQLDAVRSFAALPEAPALASANKRVGNILRKAQDAVPAELSSALLHEPAEKALAEALQQVVPVAGAAFERGDFSASLQALAALKAPVDRFFDEVMVNADDPALRANRLALLGELHAAMNRVADLSRLAG